MDTTEILNWAASAPVKSVDSFVADREAHYAKFPDLTRAEVVNLIIQDVKAQF